MPNQKQYTETYYDILGVKVRATKEEIKAAYRKLVRVYHPDISQEPGAEEKFKKINKAFSTLLDDIERLKYDSTLERTGHKSAHNGSQNNSKKSEQEFFKEEPQASEHKKEKNSKESHLHKIFQDLFDEKVHTPYPEKTEQAAKSQKINGENIFTTITITAEEALKGTSRKINIVHTETCSKCQGRKFLNGTKCTLCDGAGEKTVHKKLSIKIPPNVKEGTKIRVANEGKAGKNGGKNGDLYLNINIGREESIFQTEGNETICYVPVTPWEAALGANIQVPTPEGPILMRIPSSTLSGQRFKLVGNGAKNPKTGKKGDLIIVVNIETPKNLTPQETELYEKLKILDTRNVRSELFAKRTDK